VTLAMVLHELTTNAAKYGALATAEGHITVEWRAEAPRRMMITWTESGGPPVSAPARRGFGSDLIERGLARQLGGTATLQFHKDGLRCLITAPLPQPCRDRRTVWLGRAPANANSTAGAAIRR
jgi:two-component sensor histidine kinase